VFYRLGEENLQYISSVKYQNLILDTEDIFLLDTFAKMLTILHQWKDELHTQDKEDNGVMDGPPSPYAPKGRHTTMIMRKLSWSRCNVVIKKSIMLPCLEAS
jgi:hypothetical protein